MQIKIPKNTDKYEWTAHAAYKLAQYGLSAQRITRVIRNPERIETGIVKNTIAVMQPVSMKMVNGKKTWKQEYWAMYQIKGKNKKSKIKTTEKKLHPVKSSLLRGVLHGGQFNRVKIISAWRYPGVSPKRDPIPEDILEELIDAI